MLDLVRPVSEDPIEVVVVEMCDRHDLADGALLDQQRRDPPRRRPAAVLVDCQTESVPISVLDDLPGARQVERERLLREHVLARVERAPDQLGPHGRVRRDVHDLDRRVREQLVERGEDLPYDREAVANPVGGGGRGVVDADDVHAVVRVRGEMRELDDPAAADDPDAGPVLRRERRPVVERPGHASALPAAWSAAPSSGASSISAAAVTSSSDRTDSTPGRTTGSKRSQARAIEPPTTRQSPEPVEPRGEELGQVGTDLLGMPPRPPSPPRARSAICSTSIPVWP